MKIKCTYCRAEMNDYDEKCPKCGGQNHNLKRVGNEVPKTIEELQQWYSDMNLPPENVTRFFIGKDIKEARAFGIYKDPNTGIITVYKNKDTGERAVRYEGRDEVYAVNEIYLKLKDEITKQKAANIANGSSGKKTNPILKALGFAACVYFIAPIIIIIVTTIALLIFSGKTPSRGYYKYNDNYYYSQNDNWYIYNQGNNDWSSTSIDEDFKENYKDYYLGRSYNSGEDLWKKFEDSEFYVKPSSSSSSSSSSHDWDSSSSWSSSDSWDSGSTDWSSDW